MSASVFTLGGLSCRAGGGPGAGAECGGAACGASTLWGTLLTGARTTEPRSSMLVPGRSGVGAAVTGGAEPTEATGATTVRAEVRGLAGGTDWGTIRTPAIPGRPIPGPCIPAPLMGMLGGPDRGLPGVESGGCWAGGGGGAEEMRVITWGWIAEPLCAGGGGGTGPPGDSRGMAVEASGVCTTLLQVGLTCAAGAMGAEVVVVAGAGEPGMMDHRDPGGTSCRGLGAGAGEEEAAEEWGSR